ncbi:hypothetical protein BDF19DRAFT_436483 [Syncephalis fuscata]|nr:hypothetical protein BDF19DRAFT_436483 [Syncephalis fuscata]
MMIYLDRIKSLKPLQYNTDQTVIPKPAYDPFLLYPNEWVSQNLVDPRKADLWNIGEIFYYAFFSNIKYYEGLEEAKQMVDHTFSSIKMPRPTSSVNLQEAFKTFLPKFKYFIKHQLNDSLNSLNSNSKSSSDLAILLNLHGGFPQQLITTRPQTPFNEIVLSQSIINLLKTSLGIIYHDDHFKHYTQFILNGFYRLGIIGAVTLDYTQHSKMYAPALKMISQLLVWYPQQRPTPEDYIKQWISRETAQATS